MTKRKLNIKISKKKLIILLVILNLLTIGVGTTLAAYKSEASGSTTLQYAKIVFKNEEVNSVSVDLTNMAPGSSENIEFNVSNYNNTIRSDVNINYKLIVKSYGIIPGTIVIKNKTTNNVVLTCDSTTGSRDTDGLFTCTSSTLLMNYNTNKKDEYIATATISSNISSEYAGAVDYIEIIIDSWQKQN